MTEAEPERHGSDASIEVTVRPGLSDAELLPLARRIRTYLAAHFVGERSLIVGEVNIHQPSGFISTVVCNGLDDRDNAIDPTYHVMQHSKVIE